MIAYLLRYLEKKNYWKSAGHLIFAVIELNWLFFSTEVSNVVYFFPVTDNNLYDTAEPGQSLWALILTPTRELAVQVKDHLEVITKYTCLKVFFFHHLWTDYGNVFFIICFVLSRLHYVSMFLGCSHCGRYVIRKTIKNFEAKTSHSCGNTWSSVGFGTDWRTAL